LSCIKFGIKAQFCSSLQQSQKIFQSKSANTMTKITFIYLPHEICAAARAAAEAATKATTTANIPKPKEMTIVRPTIPLRSRL
jgi:hypothetical protein